MRRLLTAVAIIAIVACSDSPSSPTPSSTSPASPTVPTSTTTTASTASTASGDSTSPDTTVPPAPLESLAYQLVTEMSFPIGLFPDHPGDRDIVLSRGGQVADLATGEILLDISAQTRTDGERGLLAGLVGPEEFGSLLYLHYSDRNGATVVSSFERAGAGFDPASEQVLFTVAQPASNHNGGGLDLVDGALYLGLGDGGGANDRFENGQNFETLLGGIVEIDLETGDSHLWAGGLRNPWRIWIDEPSQQMIIADVGQNQLEEVSIVPMDDQFRNFGWPVMEGLSCFATSTCDRTGLTLPVYEVSHSDSGTCSITGGVTYWGQAIPEIAGHYFFSDLCGGWLRSLAVSPPFAVTDWTDQVGTAGQVVSFGTDRMGEMYVLTTDRILQVVPQR